MSSATPTRGGAPGADGSSSAASSSRSVRFTDHLPSSTPRGEEETEVLITPTRHKGKARAMDEELLSMPTSSSKKTRTTFEEKLAADQAAAALARQANGGSLPNTPSDNRSLHPPSTPASAIGDETVHGTGDGAMLKRTSADLYFDASSGASTVKKRKVQATSDNLVSKLGLKDLAPNMISGLWDLPAIPAKGAARSSAEESALEAAEAAEGHAFNASRLEECAIKLHRVSYANWSTTLSEGHPMLFHGVGTAEPVLEDFVQRMARAGRGCYVIVRGYMPGLRIEKVLQAIESATATSEVDLWDGRAEPWEEQSSRGRIWLRQQASAKSESFADEDDGAEDETKHASFLETRAHNLRRKYSYASELPPLFVVLVSIDRPALLSARAQQTLSILAQAQRIHLVASANHINAGLLLGLNGVGTASGTGADGLGQPSARINWLWQDLNTYIPPINEMLVASGKKTIHLPRAFSLNLHSHAGRAATEGGPGSGAGIAGGATGTANRDQEPLKTDYPEARAIRVLQSLGPKHLKFFKEIAMLQLRIPADTDLSLVDHSSLAEQGPVLFSAALERAEKEFLARDIDRMRDLMAEPISHGMMRLVKWSDAQEDLKKLKQGQEYFWINMSKEAIFEVLNWLLQKIGRNANGQQTNQTATHN